MSRYLLATCVFAEYSKPQPNTKVFDWIDAQDQESQYVSVLSIGEMEKGIFHLPSSKRRSSLEHVLEGIIARFDRRIIGLDVSILRRWGKMIGPLELKGRKLPIIDSLIAATALELDLTVVTQNTVDFAATKASVLNIWE
ncbi:MAG TPA: type II toxin-antitoxin system VapC family toxin [Pyrinomonadaceae bacterium]|jgi:toxin FitB|nr:type II toxin-antitoxin system VapC family toxin [Pyrinomonadaceae bacterium]